MSRARELAKAGGVQQRIAGFSSHVGMSTFLAAVHMENNLTVDGNANVGGNLTVTGTTTFNGGTLTLGDANTDNIVFGGEVDSNIIPDDDNSFDLGSSSKEWKDLYIDGTAHVDTLDVDENAGIIGNLTLTGNGDFNGDLDVDGTTNLDVVDIDGAVDMASNLVIAGNIDANGNLDVDGTTDLDATNVVGTLTVTGDIAADNVTINGNTVSTSSGNLTIDSSGGTVAVADNITVSGNGSVTGTFDVDGATTLDGLTVAEGASFSSTLDVDGATTLDGLTVAEAATFDVGVTITGALDANGGASIDNVQIGVTNDNEIDTSSGNLVIDSAGGTTTVDDNLTVSGNLTVNGTTTTINSTTVAIDDKNFQVATGAADDAAADGAGLTVDSGDGDKTFNFEATGDNWGASENLNLASGKAYKINNASILNATTLGSSVVASSLTSVGTIATGVWNGTAITNANLANSSVSYGGISLSLGGTDATPAFDLSDATNYPTSSLSGTITNTQLAGSIANGKLANSTVSYGGISLSLGGSDATPAFDLQDATGYPTSSLTGTITNAQLAGSIEGTKLENSGVTAAAYGSSSAIPIITVDAQGLVTSATTTAIDSTTISQLNTSVACTDSGSNGLVTVTADGSTVAVFDQALITVTGNILPEANGTRDLGASGTRWANVYSSDLDLSNQAKGSNSVDGTWGSYLIEEGEDHLFLTNRRNGKKYRFMVEEV